MPAQRPREQPVPDDDWPTAAVPGRPAQPAPPPPPARPAEPAHERPAGVPYPGFDPGDEPAEEEHQATRESNEEQALRLLREQLGAERID